MKCFYFVFRDRRKLRSIMSSGNRLKVCMVTDMLSFASHFRSPIMQAGCNIRLNTDSSHVAVFQ